MCRKERVFSNPLSQVGDSAFRSLTSLLLPGLASTKRLSVSRNTHTVQNKCSHTRTAGDDYHSRSATQLQPVNSVSIPLIGGRSRAFPHPPIPLSAGFGKRKQSARQPSFRRSFDLRFIKFHRLGVGFKETRFSV